MNKFSRLPQLREYDVDYYGWTVDQARLLREGRLALIDRKRLAEEVEDLGRSEKREIESRLVLIILHLLKWQFQPEKRKGGWEASIRVHRRRLKTILKENPSLTNYPAAELTAAYDEARLGAEMETGLDYETFPEACPYVVEQILDDAFFPDSGG